MGHSNIYFSLRTALKLTPFPQLFQGLEVRLFSLSAYGVLYMLLFDSSRDH